MQLRSLLLTCAALLASAAITSCGNETIENEEEIIAQAYSENVPYAASKAFVNQYPNATNVEWDEEGEYYVAEFMLNNKRIEAKAWFDSLGNWAMTELDYNSSTSFIPAAVLDAYYASVYTHWNIEDVTEVQFPNPASDYYVLEASSNGRDVNVLYFKVANGKAELIKTSTDTAHPVNPTIHL